MTFESVGLLIVAIYIRLPPASYVVFLTTLVLKLAVLRFVGTGGISVIQTHFFVLCTLIFIVIFQLQYQ